MGTRVPAVDALWASAEDTLQHAWSNGLVVTFATDLLFFVLCLGFYTARGWCRRRRAAREAAAEAAEDSPAAPLLSGASVASAASRTSPAIPPTAANYLLFVRSGFWLFVVLSSIALPTTAAVWGSELAFYGEALRSVRRTLFPAHGECVKGFPEVTAAMLTPCVGGEHGSGFVKRDDDWIWYPGNASSGDPRPSGFFAQAWSLDACKHLALVCGARSVAFGGRNATARSEHLPGQCWLFSEPLSHLQHLEDFSYCEGEQDFVPGLVEFALTLIYGCVVIIFLLFLLRTMSSSKKTLFERHALWLTELPCSDREDGEAFWLTEEDFSRVAQDLKQEIEKRVNEMIKEELGTTTPDEKVCGVVVLHAPGGRDAGPCCCGCCCWRRAGDDEGSRTSISPGRLRAYSGGVDQCSAEADAEAPAPAADAAAAGRWSPSFYEEVPAGARRSARHGSFRSPSDQRRLSGHAFVIMNKEAYATAMMRRPMGFFLRCGWWFRHLWVFKSGREDYAPFKFGVPPWSKVTLRCQLAPPASDVLLSNLHVTSRETWLRRNIGGALLFLVSLSLVAPVSVAATAYQVLDKIQESTSVLAYSPKEMKILGELADKLPSYVLLLINAVVIPFAITQLSGVSKPHLRSRQQAAIFRSNMNYLLLNSLVLPMLGMLTTNRSVLEQFLSFFKSLYNKDTKGALEALGQNTLRPPSDLLLKYLMNSALITAGFQLLQLGRAFCLKVSGPKGFLWPFPWGYWYAWCMTIFVVCLTMSVVMPTGLLLGAVFFGNIYRVHRRCFTDGVFNLGYVMDRDAEVSIVLWMLTGVSIFWVLMGFFFFSQPSAGVGMVTVWVLELPTPFDLHVAWPPLLDLWLPSQPCFFAGELLAGLGLLISFRSFRSDEERRLVTALRWLAALAAVVLLHRAYAEGPGLLWRRRQVPHHHVAALLLWLAATLAWALGLLVEHGLPLCRRRQRATFREQLEQGEELNVERLLKEPGACFVLADAGGVGGRSGELDILSEGVRLRVGRLNSVNMAVHGESTC